MTPLNPTASPSKASCPSTMRRNATSSSHKRSTSVFVDSCSHLQQDGFKATYMSVWSNGDADINLVQSVINPDTRLVSLMAVSNEIGVITILVIHDRNLVTMASSQELIPMLAAPNPFHSTPYCHTHFPTPPVSLFLS